MDKDLKQCDKCRIRLVDIAPSCGYGDKDADIMFVGQNPMLSRLGNPVSLADYEWFGRILKAIGHEPDEVYITNTVKCPTPNNRTPVEKEISNCFGWLAREIALVRPKVIVTLGHVAMQTVLCAPTDARISEMRGQIWTSPVEVISHIAVFPLYHPDVLHFSYERQYEPYRKDMIGLIKLLIDLDIVSPVNDEWEKDFDF